MPATENPSGFAKMPAALVHDADLSDRAFRLYAKILLHAWESTGSPCTVKQPKLAAELHWSLDKVQRAAAELEAAGLVTKTSKPGTSAVYVVATHRYSAATPTANQRPVPTANQRSVYVEADEVEADKRSSSSHGSPATTAAAQESTENNSFDDRAERLADYIAIKAHRRPHVKAGDRERVEQLIEQFGVEEVQRCVDWALADSWWANKTSHSLVRFTGGFSEIRRQMASDDEPVLGPFKERIFEYMAEEFAEAA